MHIALHDTVATAPLYRAPEYKPADLVRCVVVGRGTEAGLPTVDFVFVDEHGQQHVAMLTGRLVENLAAAVAGLRNRQTGH